ncbi:hypothetical protein PHYBLDRAFT_148630 [Phycomyces blakesleeanus NRRL 1555(-)]|uniref:Uncharacterized protein n=1 Tax=Phycomyces blakesleeanus (strain ATCC 8743b / DSM 1359 / FGSC 10004 / NBRC 33097 / NRRL 1555) TaxID=763407 RepID=A0A162TV32_PHYB8|nr:hypothetical protein PHYBLDRAFT_148630 [Phycomyces blakesleeanus NRRL 1555(-)]OAD70063.1 hypothetical protein PHYBLDRAFT_148630 [Phycomyces blakesleeanus NRRL 1555(-)]|eukprot:XP_018288103.1 hypothetical protein PHYBLDRAFT_148630 [Phycomyces blakesleeanus NRRL 1555(-)]
MSGNCHILPEITVGEKRIIASLAGMQANIKAVKRQLSDMGKNVGAIAATSSDNAVPASTVANPIPAPIVATILATASTEITAPPKADFAAEPSKANTKNKFIKGYMWDPNFWSDKPALGQTNENRSRWVTTVCFCISPNQELAKNVFDYLVPKFFGVGMREANLNKYVYMTYCSCKSEQNKDREARKKLNTVSRRHRHEKEHFRRCKAAYNKNKIAIDKKMAQDCSALLIRKAMSEADLSSNAHQLLKQIWLRTTDLAVPDAIASQLSQ